MAKTKTKRPAGPTIEQCPPELSAHWYQVAVESCLFDAALLQIVPWGTTQLVSLPLDCYRTMVAKIAEVRDIACLREMTLGERIPRIHQDLDAAIWNCLKAWNRNPDAPFPVAPPAPTTPET